jgi:hypothetical protein
MDVLVTELAMARERLAKFKGPGTGGDFGSGGPDAASAAGAGQGSAADPQGGAGGPA